MTVRVSLGRATREPSTPLSDEREWTPGEHVMHGRSPGDPLQALLDTRGRLRDFVRRRAPAGVDADDVVQDVLTRLLARADDVPPGKAEAWALTTARHAVIDLLRRRRAAPLDEAAVVAPEADDLDAADLARCLRPLLDELDQDDRRVLEQIDAAGRSQADLARELGVPASTVKSRVQRARQRLRTLIERCCELELDARGAPIDSRRRERGGCGDACD